MTNAALPSRRSASMAGWLVLRLVPALPACSEAQPVGVPIVGAYDEGTPTLRLEGQLVFADGTRLSGFRVEPDEAVPGKRVRIQWTAQSDGAVARVGLQTPRSAGRQQVLYGSSTAPDVDPRDRFVEVPVVGGSGAASFEMPIPWHPQTAVFTMQLFDDDREVAAIDGPRRADGVAILAVVPTRPQATTVDAERVSEGAIVVDGALDDEVWQRGSTALVESLEGEPDSAETTRVWFAWSDEHLYVAADVRDSDVWARRTQRDDRLWEEEVVELFVAADASGEHYLEYQVNPLGAMFDARFGRYRDGDTDWNGVWRAEVMVRGTVANREDHDDGWSVEVAVPWPEICENTALACPPVSNMKLRVNVFRFDRPQHGETSAWALSPTRKPDFHAWDNAAILRLAR